MKLLALALIVSVTALGLVVGGGGGAVEPFDSSGFCSQTITSDCNTTFSYIDALNGDVYPVVNRLVATSYFKYFRVNFDKTCKFWNDEFFCASQNCAVEISPKNEVIWDEDIVLDDSKPAHSPPGFHGPHGDDSRWTDEACNELDYCELDDDDNCDFINLAENPERFTGYAGKQAHNIWGAIYGENCFKNDDGSVDTGSCLTKQLFYRVISGMHASISTHLANEYLVEIDDVEEFSPNLKVFMERVGKYNDRLANLYFNYGLISQALIKLFKSYPIIEFLEQLEDLIENGDAYQTLFGTLTGLLQQQPIFESDLIIDPTLKQEIRHKFRNISSIMDCVGCDRCRMWGKLQTIGYGTAFKILFETNDENLLRFRRIELVALVNTFDRLSKSIESVKNFKTLYAEHLHDVERGLVQPGDFDKLSGAGLHFPFLHGLEVLRTKISNQQAQNNQQTQTKQQTQSNKSRIRLDFEQSLDEVYKALVFVLNSYKNFPVILFKQTLIQVNYYWNKFIGIDTDEYYEAVQLQEQGEYIKLFEAEP